MKIGMSPLPKHCLVGSILAYQFLRESKGQKQFSVSTRATKHQGVRNAVALHKFPQSCLGF